MNELTAKDIQNKGIEYCTKHGGFTKGCLTCPLKSLGMCITQSGKFIYFSRNFDKYIDFKDTYDKMIKEIYS